MSTALEALIGSLCIEAVDKAHPRELLKALAADNPDATVEEILELFTRVVKDDPETLKVIIEEVAARLMAH
jgi:hypothetical protein